MSIMITNMKGAGADPVIFKNQFSTPEKKGVHWTLGPSLRWTGFLNRSTAMSESRVWGNLESGGNQATIEGSKIEIFFASEKKNSKWVEVGTTTCSSPELQGQDPG